MNEGELRQTTDLRSNRPLTMPDVRKLHALVPTETYATLACPACMERSFTAYVVPSHASLVLKCAGCGKGCVAFVIGEAVPPEPEGT